MAGGKEDEDAAFNVEQVNGTEGDIAGKCPKEC